MVLGYVTLRYVTLLCYSVMLLSSTRKEGRKTLFRTEVGHSQSKQFYVPSGGAVLPVLDQYLASSRLTHVPPIDDWFNKFSAMFPRQYFHPWSVQMSAIRQKYRKTPQKSIFPSSFLASS